MAFLKLLPVLTFLFFVSFENSCACSCAGPGSPRDAYSNADAVFIGKVQSIDSIDFGTLKVRLAVFQSWKRISSTTIDVYTAAHGAACGYYFEIGSTYLVYAYIYDSALRTNSCTRTTSLAFAEEDLTFLTGEIPIPSTITLYQNYPNPFNPATTIQYTIPEQNDVTLEVFSMLGERITALVNNEQPRGSYEVVWEPYNLPSGIYVARLRAGTQSVTSRMTFVR